MSCVPLSAKRVLITGSPGVGKTTIVQNICKTLKEQHPHIKCDGFFTTELRAGGQREGFDVITLGGERGALARRTDLMPPAMKKSCPSVGQYCVDVKSFEQLALKTLDIGTSQLLVIDEIGKMELFSGQFSQAVQRVFDSNVTVIATIPVLRNKPIPLVQGLRERSNVKLFEVTKANRDGMVDEILSHLVEDLVK